MILNSTTKKEIKKGTILRQKNGVEYQIIDIFNLGRCTNITTKCSQSLTNIYFMPLSNYYGLEIINNEV